MLRAYRKYRQRARLALHRELPARRDRGEPAHHGEAGAAVRAALRPGARARRGGGGGAARGDPRRTSTRSPRSTTTGSCATSSASSRRRCGRTPTAAGGARSRSRSARPRCRRCRSRRRCSRSTSTRPSVEGIHLRGGKIARGGIRWSDRMDYRTEVFGLMRAQMTKNAVIVPDGAKGGFHLNRRPEDPAEVRGRGRAPVRDVHRRACST